MTTAVETLALTRVCSLTDLTQELGVAALVGGLQVALFRLADDRVYAVQNLCPFSGAFVMSRGITGSKAGVPTIASPVYKQVFALETGACLSTMDKAPAQGMGPDLATYPVTVNDVGVFIDISQAT
ncbi:MAG: nitrite reductase small subunit NirD [Demequinaceae bacterium]|nr:nitrite reductase small subunit NirD [Demequinaceae bacterium]